MRFLKRTGTELFYGLIVCIVIAAVTVGLLSKSVTEKDLLIAILPLLTTFLGATLAFRLTERKEAEVVHASRRAALNKVLFILVRQINAIDLIFRDINKFTSSFEKAFNLPAIKPPSYSDLTFNFSDLEFFFEVAEENLLFELFIEQERFHQALESLRYRNELYVGEVQVVMAARDMSGKTFTEQQAAILLGDRTYYSAKNSADLLYDHISRCHETLPGMFEKIKKFSNFLYPNNKFLIFKKDMLK